MQRQRDRDEMFEDFVAAVRFLQGHEQCSGKVGCVGFCYGGGVCNGLAVRIPELGCAVPFYGRQPAAADVPKIQAPLLIHHGGLDDRVNAGWPAYREALDKADAEGFVGTDDAQLVERLGVSVRVVLGSARNLKITTADDLRIAEALLQ